MYIVTLAQSTSDGPGIIFAIVFFLIFFLVLVLNLVHFFGLIFAIIDINKNERKVKMNNNKIAWLLIAIFVPLGPVLYYIVGRDIEPKKSPGDFPNP